MKKLDTVTAIAIKMISLFMVYTKNKLLQGIVHYIGFEKWVLKNFVLRAF